VTSAELFLLSRRIEISPFSQRLSLRRRQEMCSCVLDLACAFWSISEGRVMALTLILVNKYTALNEVFIPHIHKNGITTTPICSTNYSIAPQSICVPDTESDSHCGTERGWHVRYIYHIAQFSKMNITEILVKVLQ